MARTAAIFLGATLFFLELPQIANAHPGHGGRPAPTTDDSGCARCGGEPDESRDQEGNSGEEGQSSAISLTQDAKALSERSLQTQIRIKNAGAQVSRTYASFKSSNAYTSSSRRQALRSMRAARRSTEQLEKDLGRFLTNHAEDLSDDVRAQLKSDMAVLASSIADLSAQETRLKGTRRCKSGQCAEVSSILVQQLGWMGQSSDRSGLIELLETLQSLQATVDQEF